MESGDHFKTGLVRKTIRVGETFKRIGGLFYERNNMSKMW